MTVGFGHHRPGFGPGVGLVAGAVAGAAVASAVARPRYGSDYGMVDRGYGYGGYGEWYGGGSTLPLAPAGTGVYVIGPSTVPTTPVVVSQPQAPMLLQSTPALLGVDSVRLPPEEYVCMGGTVYFTVVVTPDNGGAPWRVQRRYNQFDELCEQLGAKLLSTPFPRKHLTGCEGAKLEARRAALEAWISAVIRYSQSYDYARWRGALRAFLEAPLPGVPIAAPVPVATVLDAPAAPLVPPSQGFAAPVAAPVLAPKVETASAADKVEPGAPVAGTSESSGTAMEVEVPPGIEAGQFLGVTVPSGEQLLLKMPDGTKTGQVFKLWCEAGTLQILQ